MKTQIEGAVITEQDKTLAVVYVQSHVFQNSSDAAKIIKTLLPSFKGLPVVLMTESANGALAYFGRPDLVTLLDNLQRKDIPWQPMSVDLELFTGTGTDEPEEI